MNKLVIGITFACILFFIIIRIVIRIATRIATKTKTKEINNSGNNKIPKVIYQTCKGNKDDPLPEVIRKNIEVLKKNNPGWDYVLFRDNEIEDFIKEHYNDYVLSLYKKINPKYGAARADFFRYLLLYIKGGVYLDIKSNTMGNLNDYIKEDDEYLLSHWNYRGVLSEWLRKPLYATTLIDLSPGLNFFKVNLYRGEYQNWHIICVPRHPFLKAVMNEMFKRISNYTKKKGVGREGVTSTTGPIMYTKAIAKLHKKNKYKYKYRVVDDCIKLGLIYKNIKFGVYKKLFDKQHYTTLKEPVII